MPDPSSKPQAFLRIICLMLATLLFIVITEQDSRHDTHQRWLAESRQREAEHRLAAHDHHTVRIAGGQFQRTSMMARRFNERPAARNWRLSDRELRPTWR